MDKYTRQRIKSQVRDKNKSIIDHITHCSCWYSCVCLQGGICTQAIAFYVKWFGTCCCWLPNCFLGKVQPFSLLKFSLIICKGLTIPAV